MEPELLYQKSSMLTSGSQSTLHIVFTWLNTVVFTRYLVFLMQHLFWATFSLHWNFTQLSWQRCAVMWSFCSFGASKSHLFSTHFHLENLLVKTELLILHISSLRIWWRFFYFCFWLLDTREIMGRWINLLCLHDYGLFCIQWILMVNWLHLV